MSPSIRPHLIFILIREIHFILPIEEFSDALFFISHLFNQIAPIFTQFSLIYLFSTTRLFLEFLPWKIDFRKW